ncbi:MAG: hypothetical protein ACREPB_05860 [Arenimonas sp.]
MKKLLLASLFVFALPVAAEPQSDTPSQASAISLAPSVEITAASLKLIPAGSRLIVKSFRPIGDLIEIVAISAVTGASVVVHVGAETLKFAGLAVGGALVVTTVSAGFLLMAGSEALVFIPNDICRSHIHHRRL